MKKIMFSLIVTITLIGCDQLSIQKQQFKWAMVDKGKVVNSVLETFKNNNPYPAELADGDASSRDVSRIQSQISQLDRDAKQKCLDANSGNEKKTSSIPTETDRITAHSGSRINRAREGNSTRVITDHQGGLKMHGLGDLSYYSKYQSCIEGIAKNQLIIDFRAKLNKFNEDMAARYRHDNDTKKKAEEYINKTIAKYAEANHFQMIVGIYSQDILYNADKVSLNVTDDIIDFIHKNQTDFSSDNKPIAK